jgi:hypothetical protein
VSHLDRQAVQTAIQVVDDETKAVDSQPLPEDILQLGKVVSQPEVTPSGMQLLALHPVRPRGVHVLPRGEFGQAAVGSVPNLT